MKDNNFLKDILNMFKTSKKKSTFFIEKDLDGEYRWLGVSTNRYVDRENEILSDQAHKDFNEYLNEHPEWKVELQLWHTPQTAMKSPADWWDYDEENGFFFFSGKLTKEEAEMLEGIEDPRMSHGFQVFARNGKIITKYLSNEVSVLPGKYVANPYTEFTSEYYFQKEEENMFSADKRAWLIERKGEEYVESLEANSKQFREGLEAMDVEFKSIEAEYLEELETQKAEEVAKAAEPIVRDVVADVVAAIDMEGMFNAMKELAAKAEANAAMGDEIKALRAEVEFLKTTEDEKMAKAIAPDPLFDWKELSASRSDDNVITEDEKKELDVKPDVPQGHEWASTLPGLNGGK